MFADEERNKLLEDSRASLMAQGIPDEPGPLWRAFVERVRAKLHIVLCMSPVGETFRLRCRQLPTLVNCCTINWFSDWPAEALMCVPPPPPPLPQPPSYTSGMHTRDCVHVLEIPVVLHRLCCAACAQQVWHIHSGASRQWCNYCGKPRLLQICECEAAGARGSVQRSLGCCAVQTECRSACWCRGSS